MSGPIQFLDADGRTPRRVTEADPLPVTGGIGGGGGAVTIADGADVALGSTTDLADALTLIGRIASIQSRYKGGLAPVVATVTASGLTIIHTPAAGKAIRLFWVSAISDPDASASPLIRLKIGALECYRSYGIAHWERFDGAADEPLTVTLDEAGSVAVTAHLEEFTP